MKAFAYIAFLLAGLCLAGLAAYIAMIQMVAVAITANLGPGAAWSPTWKDWAVIGTLVTGAIAFICIGVSLLRSRAPFDEGGD